MVFFTLLGFVLVLAGAAVFYYALLDKDASPHGKFWFLARARDLGEKHPIRFRKALKKKTFWVGWLIVAAGIFVCYLGAMIK